MLPKRMLPRCPITKMSVTKMSYYRNVLLPKCPVTEMCCYEMSVTKTSISKVSFAEMSGYHSCNKVECDEFNVTRYTLYASKIVTTAKSRWVWIIQKYQNTLCVWGLRTFNL